MLLSPVNLTFFRLPHFLAESHKLFTASRIFYCPDLDAFLGISKRPFPSLMVYVANERLWQVLFSFLDSRTYIVSCIGKGTWFHLLLNQFFSGIMCDWISAPTKKTYESIFLKIKGKRLIIPFESSIIILHILHTHIFWKMSTTLVTPIWYIYLQVGMDIDNRRHTKGCSLLLPVSNEGHSMVLHTFKSRIFITKYFNCNKM
jgi:hypothetical protein